MVDSEELVQGSVQLRRGSLMRIAEGRGMLVRVRRGSVWITEEGDSRDHFVAAGEQFRLARRGTALLSALQASLVSLAAPPQSRLAERIGLVRAGTDLVEPLALSS
ncbi:MAG TPA: DUF2917 domain-containing protein [Burkholderiales bacterium]|jgi:hypothetical protein|nr:DUF2917 domain-containing protein [Burkholderiales bacterium]